MKKNIKLLFVVGVFTITAAFTYIIKENDNKWNLAFVNDLFFNKAKTKQETLSKLDVSNTSTSKTEVKNNKNKVNTDNIDTVVFFKAILNLAKTYYVEEVDEKKLLEYALQGMLSNLDPHSAFLNKEEYKEMNIATNGEFKGIGIEITQKDGLTKIVSPIDGTPAFKAGLKAGDFITHVDGNSIIGLKLTDVVKKIRGKKGTVVHIGIVRKGEKKPLYFDVVRDNIVLNPVKSSIKLGNIAYFRIASFSRKTMSDFKKHFNEIAKTIGSEKIKGIILDLRNNPGGLLTQAIKVSDFFLDEGSIIVSTKGRIEQNNEVFKAETMDKVKNIPVVVIINEGSASASEIVAGALKDNKRAIILGVKSFGKGSVQNIIPLKNSTAVKITIARYFTPSGESIQNKGIEPDIYVKQRKLKAIEDKKVIKEANLIKSIKNNQINQKTLKAEELAKKNRKDLENIYLKDYQLGRALDFLKVINKIQ